MPALVDCKRRTAYTWAQEKQELVLVALSSLGDGYMNAATHLFSVCRFELSSRF